MSQDSLKNMLLDKLRNNDFEGLKGSQLSIHVPIHESLLNMILSTAVSTSEGMKDFNEVHFSNLNEEEFVVKVDHKRINKTIRCQLHNISYNKYSEPILIIEFMEGIRFYEKIALSSLSTFQKGMSWFKSKFREEEEDSKKSSAAVDISSSHLTINLAALLREQNLDYLNPLITWQEVSAQEDRLIIDFSIKT